MRGLNGKEGSTFDSGPWFTCRCNLNYISEADNCIESKFLSQVNHRPESNMELARGVSLFRKSVRDSFTTKDSYGFLVDFSWKQKDFCQRCTRVFGREMPLGNWRSHLNPFDFSIQNFLHILAKPLTDQ